MPELQNASTFNGNSIYEDKVEFTNADVEDFAKASGLVNVNENSVALVEELK
jgi:hypothetical protein